MRFQVILHEGVVADELLPTLSDGIRRIYTDLFGHPSDSPDDVEVDITQMAAGHLFTAGKPSSTSLVAGSVPAGTSRDDRTRLLAAISDLWCRVTGCTPNEIVVTARDAA